MKGGKKLALGCLGAALLAALAVYGDARGRLTGALQWIASLGAFGPVFFILLYIAACLFFLPGSILTLGAGAVFGVLWGTVWVSIGATLGATFAFLAGRYLARGLVERKLANHPGFAKIDQAVAREGWKIVGLLRLSPLFPFNLLNYALGLTRVPLKDYVPASWIGMLPGTILYVYLGALAGDLADLGGRGEKGPAGWAIYGVGLAATVAVTLYVTRLARKAMAELQGS